LDKNKKNSINLLPKLYNLKLLTMSIIDEIKLRAKTANKTIVLPEGEEERTLKAADIILQEGIASLVILGNKATIESKAAEWGLNNISKATIIDPIENPKKEFYASMLCEIRKSKGMQMEEAMKLVEDPLYLATLLIKNKEVDGEVAGAQNSTGNVLRPAFQIVKTLPGVSVVSGAFIMVFQDKKWGDNGVMVFADCAADPNTDENKLAQIAVVTAQTARNIAGIDPRVAMLSFSTKGSATHELVDKVVNATRIAKEMDPNIVIDGELQLDAAIIPSVAEKKAPGSPVAGKANVLVFPSLEVGNITYKAVQRFAGADAVGPIMQGMAAPINDLSRGCSVEDIVSLVAITVCQANA
jgi:phosphate acetyltransferase